MSQQEAGFTEEPNVGMSRRTVLLGTLPLGLVLSGCGNSSTPTPSPTPTLSPTPTPTPSSTATPTPSVTFTATFGAAANIGRVDFKDAAFMPVNDSGITASPRGSFLGYTNRNGRAGAQIADPITTPPASSETWPTTADRAISAMGFNPYSGLYYSLTAPRTATVVSGLTTVINAVIAEANRKGATPPSTTRICEVLGLYSGSNAVSATLNPLTFDPIAGLASSDPVTARDAARLISFELQLQAIAAAIYTFPGFSQSYGYHSLGATVYQATLPAGSGSVNPRNLSDISRMLSVLSSPFNSTPAGQTAASRLAQQYALAVPDEVRDPGVAAAFALGALFDIARLLKRLMVAKLEPQALLDYANSRTAQTIAANFQVFGNMPRQLQTGTIFAATDFREITPSRSVLLKVDDFNPNSANRYPAENDYQFSSATLPASLAGRLVTAVDLTTTNAALIDVVLDASKNITISVKPGATGFAYFDYTIQGQNSESGNGRFFVNTSNI